MSLTQHSTLNFTCWMSFKLVALKVIYNWVSSAYRWYDSPWSFIMSAIGDVYNKYNKGPRTDPWGTPHFNARCEELLFPTLTNSLREDKFATFAYRLSTDVIQLTLTLKMTTAQVVEKSVTVNNNSPIQDYVHPDNHTRPTYLWNDSWVQTNHYNNNKTLCNASILESYQKCFTRAIRIVRKGFKSWEGRQEEWERDWGENVLLPLFLSVLPLLRRLWWV